MAKYIVSFQMHKLATASIDLQYIQNNIHREYSAALT